MENPCKLIEGDTVYEIGTMQGRKAVYDFEKMLAYLEVKGKMLLGSHFKIYEEDRPLLFKLCNYFIADPKNCQEMHIDPKKGLLLTGPVGCGKTSLMKLLRNLVPHQRKYEILPCRNITFSFNHLGYKVIQEHGNTHYYCFDDLGTEALGRHYGKDCNVMGEIICSRYELFLKSRIKTHITTNLNASELEERYGLRVRSRMRELFNLVGFDKGTGDKRK